MPFKSKSQLRTCYGKQAKNWNCDQYLKETPSVCNLPERKRGDQPTKRRNLKINEKVKGKVQTGPRGGRYFIITEKDRKGVKCRIKVYLPKGKKRYA